MSTTPLRALVQVPVHLTKLEFPDATIPESVPLLLVLILFLLRVLRFLFLLDFSTLPRRP